MIFQTQAGAASLSGTRQLQSKGGLQVFADGPVAVVDILLQVNTTVIIDHNREAHLRDEARRQPSSFRPAIVVDR